MADEDQQKKIISLLATAHMLANDLDEGRLAYYIERALDEAQAIAISPRKQAPYFPG